MGGLIHAKIVNGKKVWYVWGAIGEKKWEHEIAGCSSKAEVYDKLRVELGLPKAASNTEVVFALMNKTWTGERWEDDFSVQLKRIRESHGLTQAALAEKSGVSAAAIASLEQGLRSPTLDTVRRVAHALGVTEEDFKLPAQKSD
jgi:DNA-binding XRE family transcriptional regulator